MVTWHPAQHRLQFRQPQNNVALLVLWYHKESLLVVDLSERRQYGLLQIVVMTSINSVVSRSFSTLEAVLTKAPLINLITSSVLC